VTDAAQQLVAFSHFRFEVEENLLDPEEVARLCLERYDPVVYCYELQLAPGVHRKGLGKRLMQMLELVVRRVWVCACAYG
jgi:GNAT superfamily N-acetyltransferase